VPLSPDRWRTLNPYLDEALAIPGERRAAWLADISTRHPALAADLETLIDEHEQHEDAGLLVQAAPRIQPRIEASSLEGEVFGAYRLLSDIGHGGMGSVWLAERCDGRFEGRAAVKLLKVALLGHAGEERLRREGKFLAKVNHPHIARLIDAGVSPAGQPYLVLEHVDGQRIDRYCDAHALGIEARILLFLDVLAAVAHAHANLIVHRDIKPANVLVSVDGQVKLLDFGIAKLLAGETPWGTAAETRALTMESGAVLTPEFAAPEQISDGQITTATDIYALGVLLYVLLTGQHPAGDALRSHATLIRAIVEIEPRRMSGVAAARLRRTLRGDLDTIVATALKKQPSERYASVTALAEDLRRYLHHEPISARPDTLRYRAARFMRRHIRGLAATGAAAALIGALTVFHTTRLQAERDRAQREAAKAAKISESLTALLMGADPISNRATPDGLTVRSLLDAGAERLQSDLAGQPDAQAEIFTVLGRLYRRYGEYAKAERFSEQALLVGEKVFGPEHERLADTLNDLGALQTDIGNYVQAQKNLERALAIRRRVLGVEHPDVAVTLVELARVYQDQGFNGRAEPLAREALAIRRKVLGDEHREIAVSLSAVASVMRLNGDPHGAEALLRQSLDLNRRLRGDDHANTGATLHDLALVASARGDVTAAEALFRQALTTCRKALGDRHPAVAASLSGLSHVLAAEKRYDEATVALQEAVQIVRLSLGGDHQWVALYSSNLAAVHVALKDPRAAELLLRDALRIRLLSPDIVPMRRRTFVEDDWSIGGIKSLLGEALIALRRLDEAETVLLDARRDLEAMPTRRDNDRDVTIKRLVHLYDAWGKHDKAAASRAQLTATRQSLQR